MALRRFALLALSACGWVSAAVNPALPEVRRVYILPMNNGLDQFLANRLTKTGQFEVVVDPAKADAVFTDRIGAAFEDRWNELYPPPPPPAPVKPVDPKSAEKNKDKASEIADAHSAPFVRVSSFGRGKGNVFLVSRKTNSIIWSHFAVPKNIRSKSLDETADRIVGRLAGDLKAKKTIVASER